MGGGRAEVLLGHGKEGSSQGGHLQGDVACARSRKEEGATPWLAEGGS
jgi:hypothetical protein